jgi:two-component system, cell cycle sensor histidine kinase and response regulator CckA
MVTRGTPLGPSGCCPHSRERITFANPLPHTAARTLARPFTRFALIAAAYFAAAQLGLLVDESHRGLWPAAGLALAVLLLAGTRWWPAVAVGAALAAFSDGVPPGLALGVGLGVGIAAAAGAAVAERVPGFRPGLRRLADMGALTVGAAVMATVAASSGVAAFTLAGASTEIDRLAQWWTWWIEDLLGAVIAAPLILAWADPAPPPGWTRKASLEIGVGLSLVVLVSVLLMLGDIGPPGVLVLPILFCAVRLGLRGASAAITAAVIVTTWAVWHGVGPLVGPGIRETTTQFQIFLLIIAPAGLLVGAAIAERDSIDAARRLAHATQQAVFDACPLAVVALDSESRCTVWNPAAERMFGWTTEEVLGRPLPYIPPDKRNEFDFYHPRVHGAKRTEGLETVRLRKDGTRLAVSLSLAPLLDDSGQVSGSMGVLEDLTDRRRTEESRARLAAIIEATSDFVGIADAAGHVVYVNQGGRRLVGLGPDEDIALRSIRSFHPPWAARRILDHGLPDAFEHGLWSSETALLAADGEEIPVLQTILSHRDAAGNLAYVSTIIRDIRDQKEAERTLQHRTEVFQKVFDQAPVMVSVIGPNAAFTWVNREWERVLGWLADEMQGREMLAEFYPDPAERARVLAFVEASTGEWSEFLTTVRDGRQIRTAWANVRTSDGTIIGIGRDVTLQRALEDQLRQAQKMEAVGRLAGGIAHDFNNILTGVLGCADALRETLPADDPRREDVDEIRSAATRAAGLIRQLLTFSRRQPLEPRLINLNEAVEAVAEMLRRILGGSVTLRTDLGRDLAPIKADPAQLDQVVLNLAVNARDAMPHGGVLSVRTRMATLGADTHGRRPGRYVTLAVEDSGVGMDDATRARIFEPFFTTKDDAHGTGLGLATVYAAVQQSEGWIDVESAPDRGATFTVWFPAVRGGAARTAAHATPVPPDGVRGSESILLVDDEAGVRRVAAKYLRRLGYEVVEAANAEAALELSRGRQGRVDLVLTDVMMAGGTGPQLVAALRKERDGFRVLYMSGYADEAALPPEALAAGAELLSKPFTTQGLARKVREVLDRH